MTDVRHLLEEREKDWDELEQLTSTLSTRLARSRAKPETMARYASLYRMVCSDLALARSYHLPDSTVTRLNRLVGRVHHRFYHTSR